MILITGMYNVIPEGKTAIVQNIGNVEAGPIYTQQAVETVITGFGPIFISIAIFFLHLQRYSLITISLKRHLLI